MTGQLHTASFIQMLLIALMIVTPAFGQGGRKGRGMMGDAAHGADMQLFHQLFEHRTEIKLARERTASKLSLNRRTRRSHACCRRTSRRCWRE